MEDTTLSDNDNIPTEVKPIPPKRVIKRSINQYDMDGKLIRTHKNETKAARQVNGVPKFITGCCNGTYSSYNYFKWSWSIARYYINYI